MIACPFDAPTLHTATMTRGPDLLDSDIRALGGIASAAELL